MEKSKITLTDLNLGDEEIVEVKFSRNPWGQQVLHVNVGEACALRIVNGRMILRDERDAVEPSPVRTDPTNMQSLEDIILHIRFGRTYDAAVLPMTHPTMVKIRALVDKHFPVTPALPISYIPGDNSTACIIRVGSKDHIIAFLFQPKPVSDFTRTLPI